MSRFDEKYVRVAELSERFGVCRQTINRWAEQGLFPKPLRFNLRVAVWLREEVDAWEMAREAERNTEPQGA